MNEMVISRFAKLLIAGVGGGVFFILLSLFAVFVAQKPLWDLAYIFLGIAVLLAVFSLGATILQRRGTW
jgi:hypothetical protein